MGGSSSSSGSSICLGLSEPGGSRRRQLWRHEREVKQPKPKTCCCTPSHIAHAATIHSWDLPLRLLQPWQQLTLRLLHQPPQVLQCCLLEAAR